MSKGFLFCSLRSQSAFSYEAFSERGRNRMEGASCRIHHYSSKILIVAVCFPSDVLRRAVSSQAAARFPEGHFTRCSRTRFTSVKSGTRGDYVGLETRGEAQIKIVWQHSERRARALRIRFLLSLTHPKGSWVRIEQAGRCWRTLCDAPPPPPTEAGLAKPPETAVAGRSVLKPPERRALVARTC
jgi:hypothetical protein